MQVDLDTACLVRTTGETLYLYESGRLKDRVDFTSAKGVYMIFTRLNIISSSP